MYHSGIECNCYHKSRDYKIRLHQHEEELGISPIAVKSKEIERESEIDDRNDKKERKNSDKK